MSQKPLKSVIKDFIIDEFEKENVSTRQFAKLSGISQGTLMKLLNKNIDEDFSTKTVDQITNGLNVKLVDLIEKYG